MSEDNCSLKNQNQGSIAIPIEKLQVILEEMKVTILMASM